MSKTVLFFPGQASQYVGMGQDLFETSEKVRHLYKMASDEIGEDIAKLSFEGPGERLKMTRFTQPAILLHSLAVLTILDSNLPDFDYACGHSLGEYSALAAVGAMGFEDAVKAVVRRAALMEDVCQKNPGTMAAIMGLSLNQVVDVCERAASAGIVVPANFNSDSQVAVSGQVAAVEEAVRLAKETGAKRAIMLEVGGAFHSPLMESAQSGMSDFLKDVTLKKPTRPIVANVTARPTDESGEIRRLLVDQITSPVKWAQTMDFLVSDGVTNVVEIGPGKVLSGLAKRAIRPETSVVLDRLSDIRSYTSVAV